MGTLAKENTIVKKLTRPAKPSLLHAGARTDMAGKAVHNVILLSVPDDEYNLVRPCLEPTALPQYQILHEPGEKIDFTYFLNEGMSSLVALSRDGRSVEVGIVGKEGMVGMSLTMGLQRETFRAIMQMSGSGLRMRSEAFQEILICAPVLRSELTRFALMHGMQVAQLAAIRRYFP
jgi:CRP-like cAMP-binding protein